MRLVRLRILWLKGHVVVILIPLKNCLGKITHTQMTSFNGSVKVGDVLGNRRVRELELWPPQGNNAISLFNLKDLLL
jgi:hypothetical protein